MPQIRLTRFFMMSYGHFTFKPSFVLGDACAAWLSALSQNTSQFMTLDRHAQTKFTARH